jgi:hypothetical protein
MCMIGNVVTDSMLVQKPFQKSFLAWKIFTSYSRGAKAEYGSMFRFGKANKVNTWYTADKLPIWSNTSGWWCYKTRAAACLVCGTGSEYVIRRVKIRGRVVEHAIGWRAEQMMILPPRKRGK